MIPRGMLIIWCFFVLIADEMRVRNAALQSQYEAKSAKAEKQLSELRPLAEAYQAQQTEVVKQPEEPVPQPTSDTQPVCFFQRGNLTCIYLGIC